MVITDLLNAEGEALAAGLGQRALFVHHDVADEAGWQAAVAAAVERFGALHVLVNNAGVYQPGAVEDTSTATFEWMVRVNQTGTFLGMKHALEPMKAAGGGSIVNISSIAGMVGFPGACAYVGTKWAVRGMTKTVALEFARHRIRVNSVHPGFIDTPMLAGNSDEANAAASPRRR